MHVEQVEGKYSISAYWLHWTHSSQNLLQSKRVIILNSTVHGYCTLILQNNCGSNHIEHVTMGSIRWP